MQDRSKMISLQDSASRFVSPAARRLAVSPAVGHINWLFILVSSKDLFVFLIKAVGDATSRQTNVGRSTASLT